VVLARLLSGLAPRYRAQILVTSRVSEKIEGILTRKLDAIADTGSKEKEVFYEILPREKPVDDESSSSL
jgi:hypothetical protein